jgi:hypothetical protein
VVEVISRRYRMGEQESRNSAFKLLLCRLALWEGDGIGIGYGKHGANEMIEKSVNGVFWWLDNKYPGLSIKIRYLGTIKRAYQQYQSHGIWITESARHFAISGLSFGILIVL